MDIDKEIAESRKQKAENSSNGRFNCQESAHKNSCELHNSERRSWNKQHSINRKWCCYANYKRVFKVDIEIACCIQARDCRGWSSGFQWSNGVIEIWEDT